MLAAVDGGGSTLFEICAAAFNIERFTDHEIRFALAETLAHLEYLVAVRRLRRIENGTWVYKQA